MGRKNVNVRTYSNCRYGRCLETLLHYWVRLNFKDETTGKLLLEYGADLNARDGFEKSVLHTAVSCNNYKMAKWLLNNGAFVDFQNKNKDTPLHNAANGNIDLCNLLLERGADPNYINKDGETPLSLAETLAHTEVVELLLTYGGDAARINFSGRKTMVELDSSQRIRLLCEQNISYTTGITTKCQYCYKIFFSNCTKMRDPVNSVTPFNLLLFNYFQTSSEYCFVS